MALRVQGRRAPRLWARTFRVRCETVKCSEMLTISGEQRFPDFRTLVGSNALRNSKFTFCTVIRNTVDEYGFDTLRTN